MRTPLTKKVRFEVFKRDAFTCQYCGAKAPDSILHVDHIEPIKEGGSNNILNLITSCDSCNAGKGAVRLSDESSIEKSRKQAEMLQSRREQIEMIAAWYQGISKQEDLSVEKVLEYVPLTLCQPNEYGWKLLRRWIAKYGLPEIIECAKTSFDQYFQETVETWEKAFNMIPRIAHCRQLQQTDPALAQAHRLRGILNARLSYMNHATALDVIAALIDKGELVWTEAACRQARSWTRFLAMADEKLKAA